MILVLDMRTQICGGDLAYNHFMSNNTSGFKYLFVGTTSEKRLSFIGYNFKYAFSN